MTGERSSSRNPIDISLTPCATSGMISSCSLAIGPLVGAEHLRHRGAVEIAVAESDLGPGGGQRDREIGGDGGFSDAALAGGHGDDAFHAGNRGFADGPRQAGGGGRVLDVDVHFDGCRRPAAGREPRGSRWKICSGTLASRVWTSIRTVVRPGSQITSLTSPKETMSREKPG